MSGKRIDPMFVIVALSAGAVALMAGIAVYTGNQENSWLPVGVVISAAWCFCLWLKLRYDQMKKEENQDQDFPDDTP